MASFLFELETIMSNGRPLPLSWVVKNGDSFQLEWSRSKEPVTMASVAAYVVSRQQLVLGVCAVVRAALKYVPKNEKRPYLAIEAAEAWARGETTASAVEAAAREAYESADYIYDERAKNVAYAAGNAAWIVDSPFDSADGYAAAAVADSRLRKKTAANIIRNNIHFTVADMVRAGSAGWKSGLRAK